ncbi:hypothetical protein MRX96_035508 [Rhipicephalus microplus]
MSILNHRRRSDSQQQLQLGRQHGQGKRRSVHSSETPMQESTGSPGLALPEPRPEPRGRNERRATAFRRLFAGMAHNRPVPLSSYSDRAKEWQPLPEDLTSFFTVVALHPEDRSIGSHLGNTMHKVKVAPGL